MPAWRVLVVDNDPDALDLVVTDLGLEGHRVVGTAVDGLRAVELATSVAADVMVVDHRMPGRSGVEVAERLRALAPGLRVIVYTNHLTAEVATRARRAGAVALRKGNLMALRQALERSGGTPEG